MSRHDGQASAAASRPADATVAVFGYRALVRLYPQPFRQRYGSMMVRTFRDACAERLRWRSPLASLFFLGREFGSGIRAAAQERRGSGRREPPLPGLSRPPRPSQRRTTFAVLLDDLRADLKLTVRGLMQERVFALMAIGTLALGVGVSVAVFGLYNTLLARPLPGLPPDDTLVRILFEGDQLHNNHRVSAPNYWDLEQAATQLREITGSRAYWANLVLSNAEPFEAPLELVLDNYFDMLGVRLRHGRSFSPEEAVDPEAGRVAVLSEALWGSHFGANPDVVGTHFKVNRYEYRVIGVVADGFRGLDRFRQPQLWLPAAAYRDLQYFDVPPRDFMQERKRRLFGTVIGRLASGSSATQAEEQLRATWASLLERYPQANKIASMYVPRVYPGIDRSIGFAHDGMLSVLTLLAGAVALVLLIATANVANLLFSRSLRRRGEVAVRQALGASRGRLLRQVLTESTVLGLLAGCVGSLLAAWLIGRVHVSELTFGVPDIEIAAFDPRVLAFTVLIAATSGVLSGVASVAGCSEEHLAQRLRHSLLLSGHGRRRLRDSLTVAQVAASMGVLVAAVLLVSSLHNMRGADQGFDPESVTAFAYDLMAQRYSDPELSAFRAQLGERLTAMRPQLRHAFADPTPRTGTALGRGLFVGTAVEPPQDVPMFESVHATASYFETVGVELVRGRTFSREPLESEPSRPEVVLSAALARQLFGDADPLGRVVRVHLERELFVPVQVVGVARDVRMDAWLRNPWEQDPGALLYLPLEYAQVVASATLLIRPLVPGAVRRVRDLLHELDPTLPVTTASLAERFETRIASARMLTRMITLLSAIALTLAMVGLYGAIMYSVVERTRELGIRMALGAPTAHLLRLVLRRSLTVASLGVLLGTGAGWALGRAVASSLYGIAQNDASTYLAAGAGLLLLATLSALLPARYATRVDPVRAIRAE